jgi:hypothetical protein
MTSSSFVNELLMIAFVEEIMIMKELILSWDTIASNLLGFYRFFLSSNQLEACLLGVIMFLVDWLGF